MDRSTLINELLSVKNYNINILDSKSLDQLKGMRDGKSIKHSIERRIEYEKKLNKLDPERFSVIILKKYNFERIKELYNDFILKKKERLEYVDYIVGKSTLSKKRLIKWSTNRLRTKVDYLKDIEQKNNIMYELKSYGDGLTVESTPINIQKQRLVFLNLNGSKIDSEERYNIIKKIVPILKNEDKKPIYKHLMTEKIDILKKKLVMLQKKRHKNKLVEYLLKYDYESSFLRKQKIYVLEYLKKDLQPCERGSRTELIRSLAKKNIWSRNTIRNWDVERLKSAYIKNAQDNYSPLSEYIPNRQLSKTEKEKLKDTPHPRLNKTREEILKDLSEAIYFDIVAQPSE